MTAFRLIPFQNFDAFTNMALDEAIMEAIRAGESLPTIRFYGWDPAAISIGYFQGLRQEVDLEACARAGVHVVRRVTGGGAVYHDTAGEVTYSLLAPVELFPASILDSYRLICDDVIDALRRLELPAEFQPINYIAVEGRKISGNAQTRRNGILLQHGTILYQVDVEKMFSLLTVSQEKTADKLVRSVKKRVTSISEHRDLPRSAVIAALEEAFSRNREIERGEYTIKEAARARELAEQKYASPEWVGMR